MRKTLISIQAQGSEKMEKVMRRAVIGNEKLEQIGDYCEALVATIKKTQLDYDDPLMQYIIKKVAASIADLCEK